jgi:predicted N-acetyltransferase YhbS
VTEEIRLRDARPGDEPAIRALTLAAYAEYAQIMAPSAWEGLRQAILGGLEQAGTATRIVAERGGELIGSVMLFPPAPAGRAGAGGRMVWPELRLLAVAPAERGRGVGEALVDACLERARAAGVPALGLYSSDSLRAAIRMYQRKGFERVPEYDFQPPGAELIMAFRRVL